MKINSVIFKTNDSIAKIISVKFEVFGPKNSQCDISSFIHLRQKEIKLPLEEEEEAMIFNYEGSNGEQNAMSVYLTACRRY